ncbi:MAG TPA: DUF2905 domain-containing protein [Candidatus Eisenbacteria bacterium]|nr:DUF2905 domain-containing protein [Candidatus Eisenbacteria bacterium]
MPQAGKLLIMIGAGLVIVGILVATGSGLGKLPGDIAIKNDDYVVYIPVLSSIIVSIVLSVVFWIVSRYFGD